MKTILFHVSLHICGCCIFGWMSETKKAEKRSKTKAAAQSMVGITNMSAKMGKGNTIMSELTINYNKQNLQNHSDERNENYNL